MSRMIISRMRASFLKWVIKSVVKVVKNISAIRKIKEMTGYTKAKNVSAPKTPPRRSIENANMMTKWHPNIIICTFLIFLNIVLFLLAKVNKNLKLAKENREKVSTCTNFHYIISSWKKWATTEWRNCRRKPKRYTANCNVEIAILLSKKEFWKNSSLVTRNAVSRYALGVYSADSPYATRHPTRHQNLCILLIIWVLYA